MIINYFVLEMEAQLSIKKEDDWFQLRGHSSFQRKDSVLLAYVCKDILISYAKIPKKIINKDEYTMTLSHNPAISSVLEKYSWAVIKEKLKCMLRKLQSDGISDDFIKFVDVPEKWKNGLP